MPLRTKEQELQRWKLYSAPFEKGFITRYDPALAVMQGAIPAGQNIDISRNGAPTVRDGTEIYGATGTNTTNPIRSQWTSIRRDGTSVQQRTWSTRVEYYHPGTAAWELLQSVTTANLRFGHCRMDFNNQPNSYTFFSNGGPGANDDMYKWNHCIARIAATTATTITIQGTTNIGDSETLNFLDVDGERSLIINGTIYTYTGISGLQFTGVSGDPTGEAVGSAIAQSPTNETTDHSAPSGNIILADRQRIFVAGIATRESEIRYSTISISDPHTWTITALFSRVPGDAGRLEVADGNGPVVGLVKEDDYIVIVQPFQRTKLRFTDIVDNRTDATVRYVGDFPMMRTIAASDGKSDSSGGVNMQSLAAGAGGVLQITQDNQIILTSRLGDENAQRVSIGKPIQPTLNQARFNRAASIYYKGRFFIAARSSTTPTRNDTIFVYDAEQGQWETPYLISASDFTIFDGDLHFGEDNNNTSWRFITSATTDNALGQTASFTTHYETFDLSHIPKTIDAVYIEGLIKTVTAVGNDKVDLTIELLYDRDGFLGTREETIKTGDKVIKGNEPTDAFGLSEFGRQPFGAPSQVFDLKEFRFEWPLPSNLEAKKFALRFTSTVAGVQWQILRYGFRLAEVLPQNINDIKA